MTKTVTTFTLWSHFGCVRQLSGSQISNKEGVSNNFEDYTADPVGNDFLVEVTLSQILEGQNNANLKNELNYWSKGLINEKPEFFKLIPSLENMAKVIGQRLISHGWSVVSIKIIDEPNKAASYNFLSHKFSYTKGLKINCVHRHHNPNLTAEENLKLYNKCSKVHGHEYKVEVSISCPSLNKFGTIMNQTDLESILIEQIIKPFDKTFLNEEIGNTSGEIICSEFFKRLKPHLSRLTKLKLYETRKNSFEIESKKMTKN